jgi:hypothetical protein
MTTRVLLLTTLLLLSGCCGGFKIEPSRDNIRRVSGCGFKGIILTAEYDMGVLSPIPKDWPRFTPQEADVVEAEKIVRDSIERLNKDKRNQLEGSPNIEENLSSYFRQYVGFLSASGHRILYVNMLWNEVPLIDRMVKGSDPRGYNDGFCNMVDGGSAYWQITIDLDSAEVIHFSVNGVG